VSTVTAAEQQALTVRYTYRLRPSKSTQAYLTDEWNRCRWVWNECVATSARRRKAGLDCGAGFLQKELTRWRSENPWLATGSVVAQQQTIRDFALARSQAIGDVVKQKPILERRGFPTFKAKHRSAATMNYTSRGLRLPVDPATGRVRLGLPNRVDIPVVWSRDLPSAPSSARVKIDSLGHWYVSFVVQADFELLAATPDAEPLGIDWGVTEIATTTEADFDLPHPEHGERAAANLARYQRQMARRRRPRGKAASKGYLRAKHATAKATKKVARQRQDDGRKWDKKVVVAHDQIAVEDFKPKFLAQTKMARKAADGALSATKAELISMASKHGRDLRLIDPAYTTMDCGNCAARTKHRLPLSERTFHCETCGHIAPRDRNSATVMVNRAGFLPAGTDRPHEPPPEIRAA
jgi:putative transposase